MDTAHPDLNGMFSQAKTDQLSQADAMLQAKRLFVNQLVYQQADNLLGIDFRVIGVMHLMEGDGDLKLTIRDGSPLAPGVDWVKDCVECFQEKLKTFGAVPKDGSRDLELIEAHNGMGYRHLGIFSPYLWSGTQFYSKGKYTSDGHYDPEAISHQTGAVPVLKAYQDLYGRK